MSGRRGRPTRKSVSVEPGVKVPVRQTRHTTRHTEAPAKEMSTIQPPTKRATRSAGIIKNDAAGNGPSPLAQRGTRRRTRRSIESVATEDFSLEQDGHHELEPQEEAEDESDIEAQEDAVDEPENKQNPANMIHKNESTTENDAKIQALLEIGIPEFLRLCRKIHGQLNAIGNDAPSITDLIRLETIKIPFNSWQRSFANDDMTFINFEETLFSSINRDDVPSRTKAETALRSGNLVSLLISTVKALSGKVDAAAALQLLQELDDAFPISFDPTFHDHKDGMEETFDLAFRIRCCCLAESLANTSSQQPPLYLTANIFCEKAHVDVDIAAETLEIGPYRQLSNINVNEDNASHEEFTSRLKQLVSQISGGSKISIRENLARTYRLDTLMPDLKAWAMKRLERVTVPATISNGSSTHEGSERLFVDAEEDRQADSDSESEAESQAVHIPALNGPKGSFFDGSVKLADVQRGGRLGSERPGVVPPSNQQAAKGKQKASDIQNVIRGLNSQRVLSTIDDRPIPTSSIVPASSNSTPRSAPAPSQAGTSKRPHSTDFDDNDNGDDFEVNQRFGDRFRPRQPGNVDASGASPKRTRLSPRQPSAGSQEPIPERHKLPQSSVPASEGFQEHHLLALSQGVKNIKRDFAASRPRQPRVHWSPQDTDRLIALIAEHRCAWSAIAKAGGFEVPRDQQAVRDRARILKTMLLQSDQVLPACFDMIALGQKERNSIQKLRRNPDRKESDLDEHGQPDNYVWDESP